MLTFKILPLIFSIALLSASSALFGQNSALKVFLNCNFCDKNYIRSEMTYVDYVRDQSQADIQIFLVRVRSGGGGQNIEISFQASPDYSDLEQKISFQISPNATRDESREDMLQKIKIGLIPYLAQTELLDNIQIDVDAGKEAVQKEIKLQDPWDNWVFQVYGDGNINEESSRSRSFWQLGFRADRVTEDWRIRTRGQMSKRKNKFLIDEELITSSRDVNFFSGSVVKSIGAHWSAGIFASTAHNSYNNRDFSWGSSPALEYSLFPYSEVNKREITATYKIGYLYNDYIEETIYQKTEEHLMRQSFVLTARFNQPWGRIWSSVEASNFLHDFTKRSLQIDGNISFRIFKGLSMRVSTDFQLINDQLSLPAGGVSLEEILLQQRQLATAYDLGLGLGLSYTFGSMYNNVINTRL
ncbi:MAG: hypothetical protein AAFR87_20985 [Bacteroidota bacterium]